MGDLPPAAASPAEPPPVEEREFDARRDLRPAQAALWFRYGRERADLPPNALLVLLERCKWDTKAVDYELNFLHPRPFAPPPCDFTEPWDPPGRPPPYHSTAGRLHINGELVRPTLLPRAPFALGGPPDPAQGPVGPRPRVATGPAMPAGQWDPGTPAAPQNGFADGPDSGSPDGAGVPDSPGFQRPPSAVGGTLPIIRTILRPPGYPKPKARGVTKLVGENGEAVRGACDNCRRASKKCDRGRPCGRCVRYKYPSCNDHVKFPTATAAAAPSSPGSSDPDAPPSKPFGALDPSQRPAVSEVREMNYSGTRVYEMVVTFPDIPPIGVMRRPGDSWINATHILQAARVDKGPRTRILTRDIQTGEHEKVLGGFGKHQGTWIPLRRAIELAKEYGVEELLKPLLIEDENQLQVRRGPVAGGDGDA